VILMKVFSEFIKRYFFPIRGQYIFQIHNIGK
jgi:hypothetical protein